MRVLVTGAHGFIGRSLVPSLVAAGHQVRAAARHGGTAQAEVLPAGVELQRHGEFSDDIDWTPLVGGCDAVVHLAGIAHVGPGIADDAYDRVNHRATASLARAAALAGVSRFVFMSSIRAQSGPTAGHVLTENDAAVPTEAYGASKLAAETALRGINIPHTIFRPVLVYGPGVKGNFAELMRYAAQPIPLPLGALTKQRSLLSIDGMIQAISFALQSPAAVNQSFVVADPAPVSVADMIAALRRGLGRKPGLVPVPRGVLRAALAIAGKQEALDRLDGQLIASPAKLIAAGWPPPMDTATALAAMAARKHEAQ